MHGALGCRYFRRAFAWSVPIGGLGGLIGLGGGEFRLPVLLHAIGYPAHAAVPLNLAVSFVTLAVALPVRSRAVAPESLLPHLPEILGLAAGGMLSAFYGARVVAGLREGHFLRLIAALLALLGLLLLVEAAVPFGGGRLVPEGAPAAFAAALAIGLGVGVVSAALGVAGGELLIPALAFVFGADIRVAGSAGILISLCVVASGLWRFGRLGALPRWRGARRIGAAMAAGSVLGAALGGLAVAHAPAAVLKLVLGLVLLAAAAKTLAHPPAPAR
jgi:uncharacterized membrane protein YfcA